MYCVGLCCTGCEAGKRGLGNRINMLKYIPSSTFSVCDLVYI